VRQVVAVETLLETVLARELLALDDTESEITGGAEALGERQVAIRQDLRPEQRALAAGLAALVVGQHPVLEDVQTGEQARRRRLGPGPLHVVTAEHRSVGVAGQRVEMGRGLAHETVAADLVGPARVEHDDQDAEVAWRWHPARGSARDRKQ
jgi:hypothetical protein